MQKVFVVSSSQAYEGGHMLRICSTYDKAFEFLEEQIMGRDKEHPEWWEDDRFQVHPHTQHQIDNNEGSVHWTYRTDGPYDTFYHIDVEKVY